jgi:ABC-type glycerol-3-phosphate transport system permease component
MVAPMIHEVALSFSSTKYVDMNQVVFWPKGFNFSVYANIFDQPNLWRAMGISVYITIVGTIICLFFTASLSYALSRPKMPIKKWILKGIIVTFIFSVPLIPSYMVVKGLGMENTLWALMIPGALGAFNVIIMKTFFQGISSEIFDAAHVDGCSEFSIFLRIAIPLSLPVIATIGLFHMVGEWNAYFGALIYIRDKTLYPIQILLRNLVIQGQLQGNLAEFEQQNFTPEQMKAGIILFATLPILMVYPFIQKYFVKGAMLGSLKE